MTDQEDQDAIQTLKELVDKRQQCEQEQRRLLLEKQRQDQEQRNK